MDMFWYRTGEERVTRDSQGGMRAAGEMTCQQDRQERDLNEYTELGLRTD